MTFLLHNTLKSTKPVTKKTGVLWSRIAESALGKHYDLSVILIGNVRSRRLNATYRHKDKPTNVLAFPISKQSGEIYINLPYALREHAKYGTSVQKHIDYLFIHGLLHLKGLDHSPKMERVEAQLLKRFSR